MSCCCCRLDLDLELAFVSDRQNVSIWFAGDSLNHARLLVLIWRCRCRCYYCYFCCRRCRHHVLCICIKSHREYHLSPNRIQFEINGNRQIYVCAHGICVTFFRCVFECETSKKRARFFLCVFCFFCCLHIFIRKWWTITSNGCWLSHEIVQTNHKMYKNLWIQTYIVFSSTCVNCHSNECERDRN